MDRKTVFSKTAKGLMEATGKTSVLSRDMRILLKEIDGKATFGEVHAKLGKVPEAKLREALGVLAKNDFIREFTQAVQPPKGPAAGDEMDLDFTMSIPTIPTLAKKAEEAAARAKAEAEAKAKGEAEATAKAAAEMRAKRDAQERARREAEDRARKEAGVRTKAEEPARIEAAAGARKETEE